MKVGWWKNHTYTRRSCAKEGGEFTGFVGWKKFVDIVERLESPTLELFLSLFFCGSRANELLLARKLNFKITKETLDVVSLPVFKKLRGKRFNRDRVWKFRHFTINRAEPTTNIFVDFIESKKEQEQLFDFSYNNLYYLITHVDENQFWPHRLRAERASQLVEDYNANTHMLKNYFNWSRDETPNFYVKLGMRAWKKAYGIKKVDTLPIITLPQKKSFTTTDVVKKKKKTKRKQELKIDENKLKKLLLLKEEAWLKEDWQKVKEIRSKIKELKHDRPK